MWRVSLVGLLCLGLTLACSAAQALADQPGAFGPLHHATAGGEVVQVCAGGAGCVSQPIPECFSNTCISYRNEDCDPSGISTMHFSVVGTSNLGPFTANGFVVLGPQTIVDKSFQGTPLPVGPVLDFQENFHVEGPVMVDGVAHPLVAAPDNIGICTPFPSGKTFFSIPLGPGQDMSFAAQAKYEYTAVSPAGTTQYDGTTTAGSNGARGQDLVTGGNFAIAEFNQSFF